MPPGEAERTTEDIGTRSRIERNATGDAKNHYYPRFESYVQARASSNFARSGCLGDLIPEWNNNLFIAVLAGEHVSRLIIDGHKVVGEERLLLDQHQRMCHVRQGPDEALWVVTDDRRNRDARLIRLAPKKE